MTVITVVAGIVNEMDVANPTASKEEIIQRHVSEKSLGNTTGDSPKGR